MKSESPKSDAAEIVQTFIGLPPSKTGRVDIKVCRNIEIQRDEARAMAKYWQEQYGHANPEHEWKDFPW